MSARGGSRTSGASAGGGGGAVTSVAGRTGAVTLAAADVSGVASIATTTTTKTGAYTAQPNQLVPCDATAGPFTITMPAANAAGQQVSVKLVATSGGNAVTIARAGSDVFNVSATSMTLSLPDEAFVFTSSGSGVWLTASGQKSLSSLDARYPQRANNLSDVTAATARTNLGLGGAATLAVGTAAGTVAAGDDSRIVGALAAANNLSDLASAATARGNLAAGVALAATGVKTSTYTAVANDLIPVDVSGGSVTINLPAAPADKTQVAVKVIALSGSNTCSVVTGGSDVYNKTGGGTTLTLSALNQGYIIQYKASGGIWYVLADDLPMSQLDARYAQRANNLSDLASASTARTNLGLGGAAVLAVGTTAGTVAAGDDSRIVAATPTTRQVISGTGLTGGGDLTADRTLAVAYGTSGTTAAVGNDSRLSDARTPTAHAKTHGKAGSDELFLVGGHGRVNSVETGPRWAFLTVNQAITGGRQYFCYFTPSNDITISQLDMVNGTAHTGATLIRMGLCTINGSGDLLLVARTANDTTIFSTTNSSTSNIRAFDTTGGFPATYALSAGTRYAFTYLVFGASVQPTIWGPSAIGPNTSPTRDIVPHISRYNTGSPSDLPTTALTFANTSGYTTSFYVAGVV